MFEHIHILTFYIVVADDNIVADSAAVSFLEQFAAEQVHHQVEQGVEHVQQQEMSVPVRQVQRCDLDKLPGSKVDLSFSVSC